MFQLVETPFLVAVERTLDERYTPQMETIYKILIGKNRKYRCVSSVSIIAIQNRGKGKCRPGSLTAVSS